MTPLCTHCAQPIPAEPRTFARRHGFCSAACNVAHQAKPRVVLCANETCIQGDGGRRKVFRTFRPDQRCCSPKCAKLDYGRRAFGWAGVPRDAKLDDRPVPLDLPAEEIERQLAARAKHRRQTRSWLRIEDPWQQKAGSALHQQAFVTHGVDIEGAML
jgi:hypothetical protein